MTSYLKTQYFNIEDKIRLKKIIVTVLTTSWTVDGGPTIDVDVIIGFDTNLSDRNRKLRGEGK